MLDGLEKEYDGKREVWENELTLVFWSEIVKKKPKSKWDEKTLRQLYLDFTDKTLPDKPKES
jgi:hypothetical protein